jgi:hypothetical protein
MRREWWRPDEDGSIHLLVVSVCVEAAWTPWLERLLTRWPEKPGDHVRLRDLKEGLLRLAETSRWREGLPARELAAE